jgi:hypothetical protein
MTPADFERLLTWTPEIAKALLLADTRWRQEGAELRAIGTKLGLSINTVTGVWAAFAASQGGLGAVSLIGYLKGGDQNTALEWASAWLAEYPGTGSIDGAANDAVEAAEIASAELTNKLIRRLVPAAGTTAEVYLRSRGIAGPIPDLIRYLPDARAGEGAIAALLTARERLVGVQVGYLDPEGRKSLVTPIRRRFMLEK